MSAQKIIASALLSFSFMSLGFASESSDVPKPPPMPKFRDPYAALNDAELAAKIPVLKAQSTSLLLSGEILPESGAQPIQAEGVDVEVILPQNRCETGTLTWGSADEGYTRCRVLGRGQTLFASLRDLAGLKATQRDLRNWVIAETPVSLKAEWIKNKEHFGTQSQYDFCMFRPDVEFNGASIRTRPRSTIGRFTLDSGKLIHKGKKSWGTRLDSSELLMPVRMTPIVSEGNEAYRNQGALLARKDFWIHAHENLRDTMPLESSSTYGCPRLPRACEEEFQAWVEGRNARGILPVLAIFEEGSL
jgi:hypothetical protein